MPFDVEMPDGTIIEGVPDGTPKDVIRQKWVKSIQMADREAYSPTAGMGTVERLRAGAGKAFVDLGRGIGQMVGAVSREEVSDTRGLDAPLMETGAGKVGNFAGNVAAVAPAAFIPGVNTVAGAGAVGALSGLLQPSTSTQETVANTALGGALGSVGQKVGQVAGQKLGQVKASRSAAAAQAQAGNAVRDTTLRDAQRAGYVVPPSTTNPTAVNRVAESVSGKAATQQSATVKNQRVTNKIVRQDLGMGDNAPITSNSLRAIRAREGKVYAAVKGSGEVVTDPQYLDDITNLTADVDSILRDFPEMAQSGHHGQKPGVLSGVSEIKALQDGLLRERFDANSAVELIKKLRHEASANLKWNVADPAKSALGRAQKEAAGIVEDQVVRHLQATGKTRLAADFDNARTLIAKTYSVESALNEGTGNVVATKLASQLRAHKPLSGGLDLAARFASAFPKAAGEQTTSPGVSAVDALIGMAGGATVDPSLFALPVARIGARAAILSPMMQGAAVPSYAPRNALLGMMQGVAPLSAPVAIGFGNTK
jgi:type II secretory pathway predicted ATPase ExeA